MSDNQEIKRQLLLSYVSLLAERHAYGPEENFEYRLWDDLKRGQGKTRLVSDEEAAEIVYLAIETDSWICYNAETGMFQRIDMDAWMLLLEKRGH
jgi:hypothetical protein